MDAGKKDAEQLAAFFNRTQPGRISSIFLCALQQLSSIPRYPKKAPLLQQMSWKIYKKSAAYWNCWSRKHTEYDGFHDFIEFRVRGTLPEDKAKMLASLDKAIEAQEGKEDTVLLYSLGRLARAKACCSTVSFYQSKVVSVHLCHASRQ